MLREPRPSEKKVQIRKDKKGRFQLVKLEERIAPKNSQGGKHGHHGGGGL
jgi:hypothetical protein